MGGVSMSRFVNECIHRIDDTCAIANDLIDAKTVVSDRTCEACFASDNPKSENKITCGVAVAYLLKHRKEVPERLFAIVGVKPQQGPGTELKKLISWFYSPNKKCKCDTRIQKMNKWGPDECERREVTILRWLKHSAVIARVPYFESAAKMLLATAIDRYRKKVRDEAV